MALGHQILVLVVYALAVARLTRLINADTVLDSLRLIPVRRHHAALDAAKEATLHGQHARAVLFSRSARRWGTVMYFLACPWCVGWWLALATAVIPVRLIGWPWWTAIPVALAVSHLVGVFSFAADTEETEVVEDDV